MLCSNVLRRLERRRSIKLTRFNWLYVLIKANTYGMKGHYFTNLVEGGRTINGDVLID